MRCFHCDKMNSPSLPFTRVVEGGRAYAQTCKRCGRILGMRPHVETDPPAAPAELDDVQVKRLRFVQWRLRAECAAQIRVSESAA